MCDKVYYIGNKETCDLCGIKFEDSFFDGKTSMGPWANMCGGCYSEYGYPDYVNKYIKDEMGGYVLRRK